MKTKTTLTLALLMVLAAGAHAGIYIPPSGPANFCVPGYSCSTWWAFCTCRLSWCTNFYGTSPEAAIYCLQSYNQCLETHYTPQCVTGNDDDDDEVIR